MKGKPKDATSRKLKAAWDSGRVSEFHYYSCGDFELRFVNTLTETQQEAREMQDKLEQDLKVKRDAKNALAPKKETLAKKKHLVQTLIEVLDNAKRSYMEAEKKLMVGVNKLPPAHSAQIKGMQRVSEAMSQAAKTFQPARAEMDSFELLLDQLQNLLQDKAPVKVVLEVVATISVQANDIEVSSLTLLKRLGEANLNAYLLPAVDPGAASTTLAAEEEQELQMIVDESERQPPERAPRVVD